jgi:hypothetical protein
MGIEATVYDRLNDPAVTSITGTCIYANDPTENCIMLGTLTP